MTGLILVLGVALAWGAGSCPAASKPNILFILIDDMGWMDLGCQGNRHLRTPNIDRFATEGMRFTDAYAPAPVCSPTRASVLTGRHPNRMGCFQWGHTLRKHEVTLAVELAEIPRVQPAVVIDRVAGRLFVVRVAEHNGGTSRVDLADALGIGIVNFEFGTRQGLSDVTRSLPRFRVTDGDDRRCLREAVTF